MPVTRHGKQCTQGQMVTSGVSGICLGSSCAWSQALLLWASEAPLSFPRTRDWPGLPQPQLQSQPLSLSPFYHPLSCPIPRSASFRDKRPSWAGWGGFLLLPESPLCMPSTDLHHPPPRCPSPPSSSTCRRRWGLHHRETADTTRFRKKVRGLDMACFGGHFQMLMVSS